MLDYESVKGLIKAAQSQHKKISEVVLEDQAAQAETDPSAYFLMMTDRLHIMEEDVKTGINKDLRSASGLSGGAAWQMSEYTASGKSICGSFFGKALTKALAVSELNACMGRIVAAPTAGSCGILPAALLTMMEEKNISREDTVMAMFTASAIGIVIAGNASVAGAEGGCQAECGTASAMAAAALVEMAGGTPDICGHACAIAIKNILGLVCDPVAGLVEVPCVKRNAAGVANALAAAEMALAGIESHIPADEVIEAMKQVGDALPCSLKETAQGGLATTPSGLAWREKILGNGQ